MSSTVELQGVLPWTDRTEWLYPAADIGTIDWWFNYSGVLDVDMALDASAKYLKGQRTCVQAGGCIGVWPIRLAQVFSHVHTFEPEPVNLECLQYNTAGIDNLTIHPYALGAIPGKASMMLEEKYIGHCGAFCVTEGSDVQVIKLDDLGLTDVDLIWLDIEGSEPLALRGAEETIKKCRPVVGLEVRGFYSRYKGCHPAQIIESMGYRNAGHLYGSDYLFVPE